MAILQCMLAIIVTLVVTATHPYLSTLKTFTKTTLGLLFIVMYVEDLLGSGTLYRNIISETILVCLNLVSCALLKIIKAGETE